jgi:hypothetical protein
VFHLAALYAACDTPGHYLTSGKSAACCAYEQIAMARPALDDGNAPRPCCVCIFVVTLLDRTSLLAASISGLCTHDNTVFRPPNPMNWQAHSAVYSSSQIR